MQYERKFELYQQNIMNVSMKMIRLEEHVEQIDKTKSHSNDYESEMKIREEEIKKLNSIIAKKEF
jgi:hypothetical protein